ncbi:hypothetical protein GYMLUDRAFT_33706 [Collybiopsis luxurians FD-317 M1]|nr:hypothetical protein GYMLUDRAFT_33706 [Collybiopsis luxurians FD-317 M1]
MLSNHVDRDNVSSGGKLKKVVKRALNRQKQPPSISLNKGHPTTPFLLTLQSLEYETTGDSEWGLDDDDENDASPLWVNGGNARANTYIPQNSSTTRPEDPNPSHTRTRHTQPYHNHNHTFPSQSASAVETLSDESEMLEDENRAWDSPRSNLKFKPWSGLLSSNRRSSSNSESNSSSQRAGTSTTSHRRRLPPPVLDETQLTVPLLC